MTLTADQIYSDTQERMKKALGSTQHEMGKIRTGRANPTILDRVMVDYYGTPTALPQTANISVQEGTTLVIAPYDKSMLGEMEKAIAKSDLGLTPNSDGSVLRLTVPPLSEERRKEMVKLVKKLGEDGKVAIRNIRRDATDEIQKLKKDANLPEDEVHRRQDEIQKLTDKSIHEMEQLVLAKEQEVMAV